VRTQEGIYIIQGVFSLVLKHIPHMSLLIVATFMWGLVLPNICLVAQERAQVRTHGDSTRESTSENTRGNIYNTRGMSYMVRAL